MKRSYQVFLGFAGAVGLSLAGLPALAQTGGSNSGNGSAGVETPSATPGQIEATPDRNQVAPGAENNAAPGSINPSVNRSSEGVGSLTLSEILRTSNSFSLLNSLIATAASNNASFGAPFIESGNITILAPTDQAFAALPPGAVRLLVQPENRDLLVRILENHVVDSDAVNERAGVSAAGSQIAASNGTIVPINQVLIPADVASELQTRLALVQSVSPISLGGTSSPVQVAPGGLR